MSLGATYSLKIPRGGATSYKLLPVFTYSNGYWEVYRRIQGNFSLDREGVEGRGYVGESFRGGICHGRREFPSRGGGRMF